MQNICAAVLLCCRAAVNKCKGKKQKGDVKCKMQSAKFQVFKNEVLSVEWAERMYGESSEGFRRNNRGGLRLHGVGWRSALEHNNPQTPIAVRDL
jgi:hypothetical protein